MPHNRPAETYIDSDDRPEVRKLFENLVANLSTLEELLKECSGHWCYEDRVYRFYHQSFKVFDLQRSTLEIVEKLQTLAPERSLNQWFMEIIREGTGKTFTVDWNKQWPAGMRPILEAFFHALFFLEMAVKYGKELKHPPRALPSGWAAFLYLYDLR